MSDINVFKNVFKLSELNFNKMHVKIEMIPIIVSVSIILY